MPRVLDRIAVYDSRPQPLAARLARRGYAVLVARDEAHLQTLALGERPDLVVGDLSANGSTPVGVCRLLKSSILLRHLPVVVVTERGELASRIAAVNGGADDYVVEPYDEAELLARIHRAIVRSRLSLDANPLTRLPGNASIKAEIDERLARGEPFAVLFIDLSDFKAFNDRYGFDRGDEALRVLGDIVLEAIEHSGNGPSRDFAGNIGGDDFVAITTVGRAEAVAARVCQLVDERMAYLYDDADRLAGGITSTDRQGRTRRFRLMGVAVAIVTADERRFRHHSEISEAGTEIKRYLKQLGGSRFMQDRRRIAEPRLPRAAALPAACAAPARASG